jgi:tetratricopeptide (TPR) repeat protein
MDLGLPPFDPDRPSKHYRRENCTDQYDARAMGQHALDAGMFDAFDAEEMEEDGGEGKAEYNAGVIAYERGDLDEAAQQFIKALSKRPDAGPARNNLAIVFFQRGDVETAVEQFRRLAADHPEQPNVLRNLGVSLWMTKRPREALEHLERASELDPDDGELWFLRSRLHGELDETDRMVECMRRAAEAEPESAGACDNLGVALQNAGRLDEAVEQFRKAHELEPENPLPLYNLGQALYAADRNEEAVEALTKHLSMRPEHSCAHYELARALSELGRHEEALEHFRAYEELEPRDPAGVCGVGTELSLMGRHDEAEAKVRHALEVDPAHHWAVHALALLAKSRGEFDLAAAFEEEAIRREPDQEVYRRVLVDVLSRSRPLDEVVERVRGFGGEPALWLRLMTSLREQQKPEEAVTVGLEALASHPQQAPILGTLALAHDDLGQRDSALRRLRETTSIDPDDLIAHFHAGRILAEMGEYAKACAALEYVAEHDARAVRPREFLLFCYGSLEQYDRCDAMAQEILALDPDNEYIRELFEDKQEEDKQEEEKQEEGEG